MKALLLAIYLVIALLDDVGGLTLFEKLGNKFIVIYNLVILVLLFSIELFENAIHILRVKFKIRGNALNPSLVHSVEAIFDNISDFEINQRIVLVKVEFDYIRDEQK